MFARALNEIRHSSWTDSRELARAAGCSQGHISKVCNGETTLGMDKAIRLSRFCAKHGDYRLAECFITPEQDIIERDAGRANGTLSDERKRWIINWAGLEGGFDIRSKEDCRQVVQKLEQIIADVKQEINGL